MAQSVKDFFAGLCSGWAQVVIMQPFDTVKVRIVKDSKEIVKRYTGIFDCLKTIIKEEGPLALYSGSNQRHVGMLSPLIGAGFIVSIQFGLNQLVKREFAVFKERPSDPLPMKFVGLSGIIAGMGCTIVSVRTDFIQTVVDHTRFKMQRQAKGQGRYHSSIHAFTDILKHHGIRGLYVGFVPTLLRESIGSALYFLTYEAVMRSFVAPGQKAADAPLAVSLLAGGLAGVGYWGLTYPIDYMKTLMQVDDLENRKYHGMIDCFRQNKKFGWKSFFTGYGVTMIRSVPVNAGGFFTFELVMRLMKRGEASQ